MSEYLSTEYVCGKLAQAGIDEATVGKVFAARLEPENSKDPGYVHDFDKKYVLGVPAPGRKAYLVVYRFGLGTPLAKASPLDEGGPDWRPRWLSVEGPFDVVLDEQRRPRPDCEAMLKSKELTNG